MVRKNPLRKNVSCDVKDKLRKMGYGLVGETSAVQICRWTKNSLRGDEGCWKEKFYGISSAGCCQMTPSVMWCENKCLHCWRPIEMSLGKDLPVVEDPVEILDGIVKERSKLLSGFGIRNLGLGEGNYLEPTLFTMSLSGEPTIYPRLGEMFKEIRRRGAVSFLVTNGLNPDVLRSFKDDELPTQMVISVNGVDRDSFFRWTQCSLKDGWDRFLDSLDVLKSLKGRVRRVVRLTLVKGENMDDEFLEGYVDLIRRAEPDFVHVKGFMSVGFARGRLGYDKQPWFNEVKDFGLKILDNLDDYEVGAEDERSCVVMLCKHGTKLQICSV